MSEVILLNDPRPTKKRDQDFATIADVKRIMISQLGPIAEAIVDIDRRLNALEGVSQSSIYDCMYQGNPCLRDSCTTDQPCLRNWAGTLNDNGDVE